MESRKLNSELSSKRLARIRCLKECVECLRTCKDLPKSLAYVPESIEYRTTKASVVTAYAEADRRSRKVLDFACCIDHRVFVSAEEFCNTEGQWARLIKACVPNKPSSVIVPTEECWIHLYSSLSGPEEPLLFTLVQPPNDKDNVNKIPKPEELSTWKEVVECNYSVAVRSQLGIVKPSDEIAVDRMRSMLTNWTLEHDEELAQFLAIHTCTDNDNLGSVKNYVESINVSTFSEEEGPDNITDGSSDTYWESDGNQGLHWIRLKMKKGTIVKKLVVTIDGNDDNYMPSRILVVGGLLENLLKLNTVSIDQSLCGTADVVILEDQTEHHPWLEIRIKECKDDGIDTRIHGLKIKSSREMDLGLNSALFKAENLVRYPKLEGFPCLALYTRGLLLLRFIALLDSVLSFIIPLWEFSVQSFASLEVVRQFLPLSKKRMPLIETFLRESETGRSAGMPKLYINRRAAADHKTDPSSDPDYKNTIFSQIYESLKPRDRFEKVLDYRWPIRHDQWWECKFVAEGIIDQGGGFRDSLSDIAEELCPSDNASPVPLPFFIRSPNQHNMDANVNRDVYVPNPSCYEYHHYEWIGKLMGACLRGKENLVLTLPSFVWKKLGGERAKWARDFVTVDEAEVKIIDNMESMDEATFSAFFGDERTWTTVLSDGTCVALKPNGAEESVTYSERHEYCRLVQNMRMIESEQQIAAIARGLLQVVPQAVLDLLTWQELERRICGDPEISLENLRHATHYEDLEEEDERVKNFWEALGNFSNEDRSRLLRFITGRRRLPAPLFICPEKGDCMDTLPESSTCANTLFLPKYSSPKKAEEKLRYAAYNCIAIDTDMSPWDE